MVSIIVPVYNVEDYLERCIKSILTQSYRNIELILVDDGSRDNSQEICNRYRDKDSRVTVVHQNNKGPAVARNVGIALSSGKYITFIDSDDYVSKDYVNCMLMVAETYDSDIVSCAYSFNESQIEIDSNPCIYKEYSSEEAIKTLMAERVLVTGPVVKLINKRIVSDDLFPPELMHEDLAVVYKLFDKANRIIHLSNVMYYYQANPHSITHSKFSTKHLDLFIIMDEIIDFTIEKYPRITKYAKNRDTRYAISYYKQAASMLDTNSDVLSYLRNRVKPNIIHYQLSRYSLMSKLYGVLICVFPKLAVLLADI